MRKMFHAIDDWSEPVRLVASSRFARTLFHRVVVSIVGRSWEVIQQKANHFGRSNPRQRLREFRFRTLFSPDNQDGTVRDPR